MFKRTVSMVGLLILMALVTGVLTAAAPLPNTTFTLVQGLPLTMASGKRKPLLFMWKVIRSSSPSRLCLPSSFPGKEWWRCKEGITPGVALPQHFKLPSRRKVQPHGCRAELPQSM